MRYVRFVLPGLLALAVGALVAPMADGERRAVTWPDASPAIAAFPGANGKIAFNTNRDGNLEVYVMNPDGTNPMRLTNNPAVDFWPVWSADGMKIAFTSARDGNGEIYVMNADGTDPTRLTNNPASDYGPTWSPDGSKIAFITYRDGHPQVYVMNADGSGQTNLSNNSAAEASPDWSPDGTKIAFQSNREGNYEVYAMNADGSGTTRLTNVGFNFFLFPEWSPDGMKIAFSPGSTGNQEIYVINADGSGQTNLTNNPAEDVIPAWSPDGTKIAFMTDRDGNSEIYVMNADGSGQTNLTNNGANDERPDWQPLVDSDGDGDGVPDLSDNCPSVANPDQSDIDTQDSGDVCDPCPSDATDACEPNRSAGESIGPAGGTLTTPDVSTAITIPPGCLISDTSVSITGAAGTDFELTTNLGNADALFSVNIQPSGLTCDNGEPFTIVFTWDDAAPSDDFVDGTSPPIKEDNLRITKNNQVLFGQIKCHDAAHPPPAPALTTPSCDHAANTFTFQVSSFSDFAPVAPVDNDGDDLPDDFDGVVDNCPLVANPGQADANGNTLGDACDPADTDADGFSDRLEYSVGTSRVLGCGADAHPADFNNDASFTGFDLSAVAADIGQTVPPAPARKDIAPDPPDGAITGADLSAVAALIGQSCT